MKNLRTVIVGAVVLKAKDEEREALKLADRLGRYTKLCFPEHFDNMWLRACGLPTGSFLRSTGSVK